MTGVIPAAKPLVGEEERAAVDAVLRSGALAQGPTGKYELPVVPGDEVQRDHAVRLAVNIAMFALCSNYKDDQVHAPFLMRRRALPSPER